MPDRAHIFVGLKPSMSIADFIKEIKVGNNEFVNPKKWTNHKFGWQNGYGVFSYSHSHIDAVIKYINGQEEHHRKRTFKEEYLDFSRKFSIPFRRSTCSNFLTRCVAGGR